MLSEAIAGDRTSCIEVLEALMSVSTEDEFLTWVKSDLQALLPHEWFICGVARHINNEIVASVLLYNDLPMEHVKAVTTSDGTVVCPVVRKWCRERKPQLLDSSRIPQEIDERWLNAFRTYGLRNIAAHGQYDIHGVTFTYFNFSRLPHKPGIRDACVLELVVPHMHAALVRLINTGKLRRVTSFESAGALTVREREILRWLVLGKTNWEIGRVLKVSEKTVKTHLHRVFGKLGVHNRTQAVTRAITFNICRF